MKVLVTGGAGYIGSHVTHELINNGYDVTVFDNLLTGSKRLVDNRADFFYGDIRTLSNLKELFEKNKFSYVIHLAASLDIFESTQNPILYYENNVEGTLNLLKVMYEYRVKNIIFSSTAAVYGKVDSKVLINESHPENPINPYGTTKLIGEAAISDMANFLGFNHLIFRYFNVIGAHYNGCFGILNKNAHSLLPRIFNSLITKDEITVFGDNFSTKDGTGIRDYIHVLDLAFAHIDGINALKSGFSGTYNLGNQKGYSVLEIINCVEKVTKMKVPYKIGKRREGDLACVIANNKKATSSLSWKPKYFELEEMISSSWKWFLKNHTC